MPDKLLSGICGYELFPKFMRQKILSKGVLLIAVLAGFSLSPALFLYFTSKSPAQTGPVLLTENAGALPNQEQRDPSQETGIGLPMRLKIPSINVDSSVEYVGLTPDGAVDVPKERANIAWFNLGSRPGENGSSVISGHSGWKDGKASVFDNLYKLRKGDKLYIEDDKGAIISFAVRESRSYDPQADAAEVFGSSDGKAHLNLITCEGLWDNAKKSYSKRLVVFADKE